MSASPQEAVLEGATPSSRAGRGRDTSELMLALRLLLREWRAGELRVLTLALIIAVGGISAVGFFVERIEIGRAHV